MQTWGVTTLPHMPGNCVTAAPPLVHRNHCATWKICGLQLCGTISYQGNHCAIPNEYGLRRNGIFSCPGKLQGCTKKTRITAPTYLLVSGGNTTLSRTIKGRGTLVSPLVRKFGMLSQTNTVRGAVEPPSGKYISLHVMCIEGWQQCTAKGHTNFLFPSTGEWKGNRTLAYRQMPAPTWQHVCFGNTVGRYDENLEGDSRHRQENRAQKTKMSRDKTHQRYKLVKSVVHVGM